MATTQDNPQQEGEKVLRIAAAYYKDQGVPDAQLAQRLQELADMVKHEGVRLVRIHNTVFIVLVKGKGLVEIHPMAVKETATSLAANIVALMKYLKNIGVRVAYTYDTNQQYASVMKKTRLSFKTQKVQSPEDGKTYTAYYVTLAGRR